MGGWWGPARVLQKVTGWGLVGELARLAALCSSHELGSWCAGVQIPALPVCQLVTVGNLPQTLFSASVFSSVKWV